MLLKTGPELLTKLSPMKDITYQSTQAPRWAPFVMVGNSFQDKYKIHNHLPKTKITEISMSSSWI